jgi:hypothetical protein
MLVTELGMVMEVRPQPAKASPCISLMVDGSTREVREEQF